MSLSHPGRRCIDRGQRQSGLQEQVHQRDRRARQQEPPPASSQSLLAGDDEDPGQGEGQQADGVEVGEPGPESLSGASSSAMARVKLKTPPFDAQ